MVLRIDSGSRQQIDLYQCLFAFFLRWGHSCCQLGKRAILFGGYGYDLKGRRLGRHNDLLEVDLETGVWQEIIRGPGMLRFGLWVLIQC